MSNTEDDAFPIASCHVLALQFCARGGAYGSCRGFVRLLLFCDIYPGVLTAKRDLDLGRGKAGSIEIGEVFPLV